MGSGCMACVYVKIYINVGFMEFRTLALGVGHKAE